MDHIELQKSFDEKIDVSRGPYLLFQHLRDIAFFLKDEQCRLIRANHHFYRRFGFEQESQLIGKNDFELFPMTLAKKFRADDEAVMNRGESMLGMVELFLNRQGIPDWYMTNKMPVFGLSGSVIGVMGTVQRLEYFKSIVTHDDLVSGLIKTITDHLGEELSFAKLSKSLKISHRQLDRRFKEATGLSPQKFLNRKRIEVACKKLREERTELIEIALNLGYCDQSAFTAQFRQCMGMTPLKYRSEFKRKENSLKV